MRKKREKQEKKVNTKRRITSKKIEKKFVMKVR